MLNAYRPAGWVMPSGKRYSPLPDFLGATAFAFESDRPFCSQMSLRED